MTMMRVCRTHLKLDVFEFMLENSKLLEPRHQLLLVDFGHLVCNSAATVRGFTGDGAF
jgi:hypothetical protein